jgi:class 3 adenylate cyclase/CHASE2 domain-containing sensor protein
MKRIARWAQQIGVARAVCFALLFALVPLRLADPAPLAELRVRAFDFFQVLRPRVQTIRPVVIVDIDEASLKEIGQWPWPRTTIADLVTSITQLGAVAIGFDIIFPEPDRLSPAVAERSFRGIDPDTRAKLDSLPSNDDALADAIKHSRVVVGQAGSAVFEPKTASEAALQTGFAVRGPDPSPYLVTFPGLLRNVPQIEQAAAGRGLFSINPESDGIIRRVPVIMKAQGTLVPSLTMEMLRVVTGSGAILVRVDDAGVQAVAVPGLEVPTDRNGQFWVHFNKHDPARYVSAKDVLQGKVPADRLSGRLVLIGTSAIGLLDLKTTPVDAAIYLVLTFVNYFREQKQRRQIRSAFGYYLSPHMVEQLARSPEKLVLGGEERRMTILFSDVRGFTMIAEHNKDDPQGLTRLMNRFLTPLTNAIIERKGTIDKYIGDAIMAFWNAPVDDSEQESNACDAALEMLSRAATLNDELKEEAQANGGQYMPLRVGIGLNTGPCVVGNMGSDFRFNYSVLGDTVNLASRLEARTKDYRVPIVIGSRTAEAAQRKFAVMEIDLILVKGKITREFALI